MTLDANILVYAFDHFEPVRQNRASDVIYRASDVDCVLTLQSLGEVFHVVKRKWKLASTNAMAAVDGWREIFPVVSAGEQELVAAMNAADRHGMAFWDALLWATARAAGCDCILTEDYQSGRDVEGVLFLDPFDTSAAPAIDALLG